MGILDDLHDIWEDANNVGRQATEKLFGDGGNKRSTSTGGNTSTAPAPTGTSLAGMSFEDLLANGPQLASEETPLLPSGVPADGFQVVNARGETSGVRYTDKSLLEPLKWSIEDRTRLQMEMQQAGLYGRKNVRAGTWSTTDVRAYAELLQRSNLNGYTAVEMLGQLKAAPITDEIDPPANKPTFRVSNPLDVAQTADSTAQDVLGRKLRPGEQPGIVSGYQGAEMAAQKAMAADQEGGGGGTVTEAPSAAAFAENQIRSANPTEADAYGTLGAFDGFLKMIGAAG